jgi:DNA-directed RNA polymerase subunit RPC12/RpoP
MPRRTDFPCCPNGSHYSCWYAHFAYKPQYACFGCRKAFKRRLHADVDPDGEWRAPRCPECGGEVVSMGVGFRPPRRQQVGQWRRLAALAAEGATFLCCGGAKQPRSALDFQQFLAQRWRRGKVR